MIIVIRFSADKFARLSFRRTRDRNASFSYKEKKKKKIMDLKTSISSRSYGLQRLGPARDFAEEIRNYMSEYTILFLAQVRAYVSGFWHFCQATTLRGR